MTNSETCTQHSGCVARIEHLEKDSEFMHNKLDKILMRFNIMLGGIAVACILLLANLAK